MSEHRTVIADWQGGKAFIGQNQSGAKVTMGTLGDGSDVSPMELLLMGLAGCTGIDVALILEKKRQPLADLRVVVRGKRAEEHPRVYTHIEIEYLLWGEGLSEKAVRQAIDLSEQKYCSASAMLGQRAEITSTYRILSPGEKVE
jgi:putative redox protein